MGSGSDDASTFKPVPLQEVIVRPEWQQHFIEMAYLVATMATCPRKHVGAVLVNADKRIVGTGFNGSAAGMEHCDVVGCDMVEINGRMSCVRTIHAESNVLDFAGQRARGCTLYVTVTPCFECTKRIVNTGIVDVIYDEYYASQNTERVAEYFRDAGVGLIKHEVEETAIGHEVEASIP